MTMKNDRHYVAFLSTLSILGTVPALMGCDSDAENAAEKTADKIEDAADEVGDKIEDAGDAIKDAAK